MAASFPRILRILLVSFACGGITFFFEVHLSALLLVFANAAPELRELDRHRRLAPIPGLTPLGLASFPWTALADRFATEWWRPLRSRAAVHGAHISLDVASGRQRNTRGESPPLLPMRLVKFLSLALIGLLLGLLIRLPASGEASPGGGAQASAVPRN